MPGATSLRLVPLVWLVIRVSLLGCDDWVVGSGQEALQRKTQKPPLAKLAAPLVRRVKSGCNAGRGGDTSGYARAVPSHPAPSLLPAIAALDDGALARRVAAAGGGPDSAAEAELYRRLAPRVRLYGLRHLRDRAAAADLVQQVLLMTLERLRAGEVREPER